MKNILVRVDSSSKIGIGHVMRDLVLVKQYPKANIIFACQDLEGNINFKIKNFGYEIKILKSNYFEELDLLLKKLKINFLIIDHYKIDYNFEKQLKSENLNLKILSFDDTYEKHYCDILLNHNIYGDDKKYKGLVPEECELRCGEKHTLIRDEFIVQKNKKAKSRDKKFKILIAFGGSDFDNISLKVLKTIKDKKNIDIYTLSTSSNKNIKTIKKFTSKYENMKLIIDSNEVAKLINSIDLAIVSPSTILHEIKYLEKKFIAIQTASNQKFMMKYLKKSKENSLKKFSKKKFLKIFERSICKK